MNDIEQIIEKPKGRVLLRFSYFPEPTNLLGTSTSRKSFSDFHSDKGIPVKKPQNYWFRSSVAEPATNNHPSPSSPGIRYGCNVLISPNFIIDWPFLKEDYYSTSNASMQQWFKQIDGNLRENVKKEWIANMQKLANPFTYLRSSQG